MQTAYNIFAILKSFLFIFPFIYFVSAFVAFQMYFYVEFSFVALTSL